MSDGPEFDLSELTWADGVAIDLAGLRAAKAMKALDPDAAEEALATIRRVLATVVVSVPRAWLVTRAPEPLDWRDPESFRWLKSTHMEKLIAAWRVANRAENATGN